MDKGFKEVRIFYTKEDMLEDYNTFAQVADRIYTKDTSAILGDTKIRWYVCNEENPIRCKIAGLEFYRVFCDVRVPKEEIEYTMTRIRGSEKIEPVHLFRGRLFDWITKGLYE